MLLQSNKELEQKRKETEEDKYPRDKDGKIDYDEIKDPATYLEALESEFTPEEVASVIKFNKEEAEKATKSKLKK